VVARAFDFAQEAKRQREEQQQVAVKIESPPKEPPVNRVNFSQAAQTRLTEEKSHVANQVEQVRIAKKAAAADEASRARKKEYLETVEIRAEARKIRADQDRDAQVKTAVAVKVAANTHRVVEASASAARKVEAETATRVIEVRARQADEAAERTTKIEKGRIFAAQAKEATGSLEKSNRAVAVENRAVNIKNNRVAVEHVVKLKVANERSKAETAKAVKMYQHVKSLG